MPNSEWWHDHRAETEDGAVLDFVGVGDIPELLAEHRELIVKEIREEIAKLRFDQGNLMLTSIFELPCLKENEWYGNTRMVAN